MRDETLCIYLLEPGKDEKDCKKLAGVNLNGTLLTKELALAIREELNKSKVISAWFTKTEVIVDEELDEG